MVNSAYSPIQHLAHSFFFKHDPEQRYFAMLTGHTVYFDTSGSRTSGNIMAVAGAIASVKQWDEFDIHWKLILEKVGIDEFHMTDFVGHFGSFKDEKWKLNNGFSENFLKKLVNSICRHVSHIPIMLIYLDDWREINQEYQLKESGYSPLALAGASCIAMIHSWSERHRIAFDTVNIIFERGDLDRGDLIDLARRDLGIILPPFGHKKLRPLQACDLIAWEAAFAEKQLIKAHSHASEVSLRPSIREIVDRVDVDPLEFKREGMLKICESNNIPKR